MNENFPANHVGKKCFHWRSVLQQKLHEGALYSGHTLTFEFTHNSVSAGWHNLCCLKIISKLTAVSQKP